MSTKSIDPSLPRRGLNVGLVIGVLIWLIAFSLWFHHFDIPNNQIPRWMFWTAVPFDFMDLIDPPADSGSLPWSWLNLFQRVPYLLVASTIWMGAWGLGSLVLRGLKLSIGFCEQIFFSLCLGLSCVSLITLMLGVAGLMNRWLLIAIFALCCVLEIVLRQHITNPRIAAPPRSQSQMSRIGWLTMIVCGVFVACQLLGAMSPQTDFDVVEYHLGGPKEWYQAGRIFRLPHNVYTSFPFLAEMLVLSGMEIYGDWQWGALAGQAAIAGFAPLTALGLFAAGRRWFSARVGWLAALVYLSSPWTYRFSIIAYVEGALSCYLFAALFAALLYREQLVAPKTSSADSARFALLAGLLAGSAMACKYTGLLMVVAPIGMLLIVTTLREETKSRLRTALLVAATFSLGVLGSIGPWMAKNAVETGNPVYPLGVRVFGGVDRTEELDLKWRHAHAAVTYANMAHRLNVLIRRIQDVIALNDWHSPLMFGLAPLSLLFLFRNQKSSGDQIQLNIMRWTLSVVWLYVIWQFIVWFCFTHQIDRFYVPMFSAVALLAGVGGCWWEFEAREGGTSIGEKIARWSSAVMIVTSLIYNADIMFHGNISGFNAGRLDLNAASQIAVSPRIAWLNKQFESGHFPREGKVLCVGEALMFHARYPYLYNTVFDHSIIEQICADPATHGKTLRPVEEIREELQRRGITQIDVNWSMILRYREPGNYGFTDFVNPELFVELQRLGIIGPPLELPNEISLAKLSDDRRQLLIDLKWDSSLIKKVGNEEAYTSAQIFPVINSEQVP